MLFYVLGLLVNGNWFGDVLQHICLLLEMVK